MWYSSSLGYKFNIFMFLVEFSYFLFTAASRSVFYLIMYFYQVSVQ